MTLYSSICFVKYIFLAVSCSIRKHLLLLPRSWSSQAKERLIYLFSFIYFEIYYWRCRMEESMGRGGGRGFMGMVVVG